MGDQAEYMEQLTVGMIVEGKVKSLTKQQLTDIFTAKELLMVLYVDKDDVNHPFEMEELNQLTQFVNNITQEVDVMWGLYPIEGLGDKVKITLCGMDDIKSVNDIEYFLMECRFPWAGSSKIEDIAKLLNNWQANIDEEDSEKQKLRKYYEENYGTEKFDDDWFSDWHKDVYGFRPHNGPAWL